LVISCGAFESVSGLWRSRNGRRKRAAAESQEDFMNFRAGALKIAAAVFLAIFLFHPHTGVWAADLTLKLEVGATRVEVGERIPLKIIVEGRGDFTEPVLPDVAGLELTYQGRAQSVQIINTQVKTSKIFTYVVTAEQIGQFTLGPARLDYSGGVLDSNTVTLTVSESVTSPAASKEASIVVEASVDNGNPFVGQQVTLLFRLARTAGARIRNAGYELPDLTSFWTEGIESRREYSKDIDGKTYLVTEVAIPLFPIREGKIAIDPIVARYEELVANENQAPAPVPHDPFGRSIFDDDFFKIFRAESIVKRTARTKPITLYVRPLPVKGMPAEFKGGVGKFSLSARLSNEEVKVGESVTLTLALSGEGNIRDLADPKLQIESAKIYSDSPSIDVKNYHDKVVGEKIYKLALVPQQAGVGHIPQIAVPYFNPESERFEFASSGPLQFNALPAETETLVLKKSDGTSKQQALSSRSEILPIHERIDKVKISRLESRLARLRPLAYPLPLLVYALSYVFSKRRERLKTDLAYRRSRFAGRTAEESLVEAGAAFNRKEWDGVFSKCSKAITEYLAAKLNVSSSGLTPAEVKDILNSREVPEMVIHEVTEFLEFCDYGRFTSSRKSPAAARECLDRANQLLERLEGEAI
jgi:hypothetical protein